MEKILNWLSTIPFTDRIGLAIGVVLGLGVLFALRARQSWAHRQSYGYDVYTADRMRSRLVRWAAAAVGAALLITALWLFTPLFGSPTNLSFRGEQAPPFDGPIEYEDTRLLIPRLALEADMIEAPVIANQWDISRLNDEVAHLDKTVYPGEPGNAVLAGHVTIPGAGWGPFKDLETLVPGDRVFVERGNVIFAYEVDEIMRVDPSDVYVAYPTEDTRLTLITCAGWSDLEEEYTERVVVVAYPAP